MSKIRGLARELAEVRQLRQSALSEETDHGQGNEEGSEGEGVEGLDEDESEEDAEGEGDEENVVESFDPDAHPLTEFAWLLPIARVAATQVAGKLVAAKVASKFKKRERQESIEGENELVPMVEDFRRLSGFMRNQPEGPTSLEFDATNYLAAISEMVSLDVRDMLTLSEEDREAVAQEVSDRADDIEAVTRAAIAAKMNGQASQVREIVSSVEQRELAMEVVAHICQRCAERKNKACAKAEKAEGSSRGRGSSLAERTKALKDRIESHVEAVDMTRPPAVRAAVRKVKGHKVVTSSRKTTAATSARMIAATKK